MLMLVVKVVWCFEVTIVMLVAGAVVCVANIVRVPVEGWLSIVVVLPDVVP